MHHIPQIYDSVSHDVNSGTSVAIPRISGQPAKKVVLSTNLTGGIYIKFGSDASITAGAGDAHFLLARDAPVVIECAGYTHIGYSSGAGRMVVAAVD